jgi:DNA repair exonuclease SbcCD ATPase subunit
MNDFQQHSEDEELLGLEQTPSAEELQDQVRKAQDELLHLRQKQEMIEREKQRLEELTRKQDEFERGRNEISDKLTRAIALAQRETEEAQRRLEQLHAIQDSFAEHLRNLEEIDPKAWPGKDLARELTRALGTVDEARAAYSRSHAKISPADPENVFAGEGESSFLPAQEQGFAHWLQCGLAFTLPLLILGGLALLISVWHMLTAR